MDLKRLEYYREYFNKQKGRKYPCSNQIVRCAIVTNDRDKVVDFMSDKEVVKKLERKDYAAWLLDNGEQWIWHKWNENCRGYRFYKVAVDKNIKDESDNPTFGILLWKKKKRITAELSLKDINKPIGVSEYKILSEIPEFLENTLPSIEDIEKRLEII